MFSIGKSFLYSLYMILHQYVTHHRQTWWLMGRILWSVKKRERGKKKDSYILNRPSNVKPHTHKIS